MNSVNTDKKISIGFCGCSLTEGQFLIDKETTRFSFLVGEFLNLDTKNYAVGGSANSDILLQSLQSIQDNDITIVEWSSPGRQKFYHYADYYNYSKNPNCSITEINAEDYRLFTVVYQLLDSHFNQYHYISKYTTILDSVAEKLNKKIFYMNGLLYIDEVFLNKNSQIDFSKLSVLTKEILNFDNLLNDSVTKNLTAIQNYLTNVTSDKWINTTVSMRDMIVDLATDDRHPGPLTQKKYTEMIINFLIPKIYD